MNVLDRYKALEQPLVINNKEFLYAVFLQLYLCLVEGSPDGDSYKRLRRHYLRNRNVKTCFEPQVTIGNDADKKSFFIDHRHAADLIAAHYLQSIGHELVLMDGHRIDDHARLASFYLINLLGLLLNGEILVNDADTALLCERYGKRRLGDGIHRR